MNIENMDVFKLSHSLVLEIYKKTQKYPADEKYALTVQMRRAASAIPMNLIEGSHRNSRNEYRQFVGIAKGSAAELKYQLLLSRDIGYIAKTDYELLSETIQRVIMMLEKLNSSLKS